MKKTLIALAALAATGAFAQSSVELYGIIDVAYMSHATEAGNGTTLTKSSGIGTGFLAGSRLGFRGTEDLGGGLKAQFVMEQGIEPTSASGFNQRVASAGHQIGPTASTAGNNRQAYVGLTGGFGTVRAGYQYTNSYDLVAFNGLNNWEFQGGNFQNAAHINGSRANSITYISPKLAGAVTVKAQLGSGAGREVEESSTANSTGYTQNNTRYMSLFVSYANGPLFVGFDHSRASVSQAGGGGNATNIFGGVSAVAAVTNTGSRDGYANTLGASYDFGAAKLSYVWARSDNGGSATSTNGTVVQTQQLSVGVPLGKATLMASTGGATTESAGVTSKDIKGMTFGVKYSLSKRTTAYAFVGSETDSKQDGLAGTYRDSQTAIGLNHSF